MDKKTIAEMEPERLRKIRLIVTDVDGVLTDGRIGFTSTGAEIKYFNCKDGCGFAQWHRAGGLSAFLTGRGSSILLRRAQELRITKLVLNAGDKLPELRRICEELDVPLDCTLYMGDDLPDLECLRAAGIGVAVADASEPALAAADAVTRRGGGQGAFREVVDVLLNAPGKTPAEPNK